MTIATDSASRDVAGNSTSSDAGTRRARPTVLFARLVLVPATVLLTRIAATYVLDPAAAVAPHGIALGTAEAMTMMRVSGSLFLGMAIVLSFCVVSERRLATGLGFLAVMATTILAARLFGLALDGPAPFTLKVLKPEIALVVLSTAALVAERRRLTKAVAR